MATVSAVKSGNWSDPTVWSTGALPDSADIAAAASYVVTVDGTYTVAGLTHTTGYFDLAPSSQITSTNLLRGSNTAGGFLVRCAVASPSVATIVGNIYQPNGSVGGVQTVMGTVLVSGTGTLNIIGNVDCSGAGSHAFGASIVYCVNVSSGTVNITGGVFGANGGSASTYYYAITSSGAPQLNITGNIIGGTARPAAALSSGTTLNVTGNSTANSQSAISGGTVIQTGIVTASSAAPAVSASVGVFSGQLINTSGQMAFYGAKLFLKSGSPVSWQFTTQDLLTDRTIYTADQLPGVPSAANVRHGTAYGASNELTGSCRIPPATAVASGVPVDASTGTAVFDPAAVWDQLTADMTTSGSIGERLKNAATVQSVGDQWAAG